MLNHLKSITKHAIINYYLISIRTKLPPRKNAWKSPAKGLLAGATVERGQDWEWEDQDGTYTKQNVIHKLISPSYFTANIQVVLEKPGK